MNNNPQLLRVLVFGAGAIGTFVGGSLALHGHTVIFIERTEVAQQVAGRGLYLQLRGVEHHIREPHMVTSLDQALEAGPFDIVIFAIKSNDTYSALERLSPLAAQVPPVLCLQNGVENEPALAGVLGTEKVIPGTMTSAVGRRAAGDIVLERERGMGIYAGHPNSASLAEALNGAGLNACLYSRAADMKWSKMLTNLMGNATSAILNMEPGEVFAHPGLFRMEVEQLRETLRVMAAQRIGVVDLPKTPVRLLAYALRFLPIAALRPFLKRAVGTGRGGKMPSFYLDLYSGRGTSEVDYLNGAVVRYGERLGIPTPTNRLLNETLLALTRKQLPLDEYARDPAKLLKEWEAYRYGTMGGRDEQE